MAPVMELVAGDRREIVLLLAGDDVDPFADRGRFPAHLALGAGLDPTWLDLFSQAARQVTGLADPIDFLDARNEAENAPATGRTVERIDARWVGGVAALPSFQFDAIAGAWVDLLREEELGLLAPDEKPWIRELVERLVEFARAADGASDVLFSWSM